MTLDVEELPIHRLSDQVLLARIKELERRYGCSYRGFLERRDFDERPGHEWMDEMLWRVLEEELSNRIAASVLHVVMPLANPRLGLVVSSSIQIPLYAEA